MQSEENETCCKSENMWLSCWRWNLFESSKAKKGWSRWNDDDASNKVLTFHDVTHKNSPNSLRKKFFLVKALGNKLKAHTHSQLHTKSSLDTSVEKKGNPSSPHQKFTALQHRIRVTHFAVKWPRIILLSVSLEQKRIKVVRKSSLNGWQRNFVLSLVV